MTLPHRSLRGTLTGVIFATLTGALGIALPAAAQDSAPGGRIVVSGVVPDEAARTAILGRLRTLYGSAAVVDQLETGGVIPPPQWTEHVTRLIGPDLKDVRQGRLEVAGTRVAIRGKVADETRRQQIGTGMAASLATGYTFDNALAAGDGAQGTLDRTLANRVVEFESGSATLTPVGVALLDEMAHAIRALGTPPVQIIGHTDATGERLANIGLSLARADAVRAYLIGKGIPADTLSALGAGPDRPLTTNDTATGRARNRRIEFRLAG